jgi:hypothetical protein
MSEEHPLDADWFWAIVQRSLDATPTDRAQQNEVIAAELRGFTEEELAGFVRIHGELCEMGYNWDLWGALCVISGGCSDDQLWHFLGWLISRGREWFERAVRQPDDLAEFPGDLHDPGRKVEDFARVAYDIHLAKFEYYPDAELWPQGKPAGERWEPEEEVFRARALAEVICEMLEPLAGGRERGWCGCGPRITANG